MIPEILKKRDRFLPKESFLRQLRGKISPNVRRFIPLVGYQGGCTSPDDLCFLNTEQRKSVWEHALPTVRTHKQQKLSV